MKRFAPFALLLGFTGIFGCEPPKPTPPAKTEAPPADTGAAPADMPADKGADKPADEAAPK